jgi:hypothetical protein
MDARDLRLALRVAARILDAGEVTHPTTAPNHWSRAPVREHAVKALEHLDRHLVGASTGEDDLALALARLLLAVERARALRVDKCA